MSATNANEKWQPNAWNATDRLKLLGVAAQQGISAMTITPDGKRVLVADHYDQLQGWSLQTGQMQFSLRGEQETLLNLSGHWATGLAVSPDAATAVSVSYDGLVKWWNLKKLREAHANFVGKHRDFRPPTPALSPDLQTLAVCTTQNDKITEMQILDATTGKQQPLAIALTRSLTALAFSPDGMLLAGADDTGRVAMWNLRDGGVWVSKPATPKEPVTRSLAVAPDGKTLAAGRADGSVCLWDARTGTRVGLLHGYQSEVRTLVLSPQGWLVPEYQPDAFGVAFSPDGRTLADAGDGAIEVWDVATGTVKLRLTHQFGKVPLRWLQFAPSRAGATGAASVVVAGSYRGAIEIWDLGAGRLLATMMLLIGTDENPAPVGWITYTPDAYYTGSEDVERYIQWRDNGEVTPGEKLADSMRRPDKVEEALQSVH